MCPTDVQAENPTKFPALGSSMKFSKSLVLLMFICLVLSVKQPGIPDRAGKPTWAQNAGQNSDDVFAGESEEINVRLRSLDAQRKLMNWKSAAEVIDEILELRPENAETWTYLAWLCGYDAASEQVDPSAQYDWVKRGIAVLLLRHDTHPSEPETLWQIGRLIGEQLDRLGFRQKFADDVQFQQAIAEHLPIQSATGPDGKCHCRLVAWLCHVKAVEASENGENKIMMPVVFCSYPAKNRAEFARAIEQDGYCGEEAVQAWQAAMKEWRKLGELKFKSPDGFVQLNPRPGEDKWAEYFRTIANFDYWIEKCKVEQSNQLRTARKLLYNALSSLDGPIEQKQRKMKTAFDDAFVAWNTVLAQHRPLFDEDDGTREQLHAASEAYVERFYQGDQLPQDSPLRDLLDWLETP